MGKIVIHQTDEKQTVILTNDADGIQGVYFGEDGEEKPVGRQGEWTTDGILLNQEPNGDIISDITVLSPRCLAIKPIKNLTCENVAEVKWEALEYSGDGTGSVYLPNCSKCGQRAFSNSHFKSIYIGGTDATTDPYAFQNCADLEEIHFPRAAAKFSFQGGGLSGDTKLKLIDFGNASQVGLFDLPTDNDLRILICRRSSIPTISGNLSNSKYFKNGGLGGKVYVPQNLIENYKTTGTWKTYYEYGTMEFLPIEGSEYEL